MPGSWTPSGIESALDNKGPTPRHSDVGRPEGTNKYVPYLRGTLPGKKTRDSAIDQFPSSNLAEWALHPIGLLLTDTTLTQDQVVALLDTLPARAARSCIWDESVAEVTGSHRREVPDVEENIEFLAQLGTSQGFLALLGRLRLRQLQHQTEHTDKYEDALLDCLSDVLTSDPHLFLAKPLIVVCVADFLDWTCGWRERDADDHTNVERRDFWEDILRRTDLAEGEARLRGLNLPPLRYVKRFA